MLIHRSTGLGEGASLLPPVLTLPASPAGLLVASAMALVALVWLVSTLVGSGQEAPARRPRTTTRRAAGGGMTAEIASALKSQGVKPAEARRIAAAAAEEGGDFDAVLRRAIRMGTA